MSELNSNPSEDIQSLFTLRLIYCEKIASLFVVIAPSQAGLDH